MTFMLKATAALKCDTVNHFDMMTEAWATVMQPGRGATNLPTAYLLSQTLNHSSTRLRPANHKPTSVEMLRKVFIHQSLVINRKSKSRLIRALLVIL